MLDFGCFVEALADSAPASSISPNYYGDVDTLFGLGRPD
jgi:hypothetical protein